MGYDRRARGSGRGGAHGGRGNGDPDAGEGRSQFRAGLHAHERGRRRADLSVLRPRGVSDYDEGSGAKGVAVDMSSHD